MIIMVGSWGTENHGHDCLTGMNGMVLHDKFKTSELEERAMSALLGVDARDR